MRDLLGTTRHPVSVLVVGAGYAGLTFTNRFLGSLSEAEHAQVGLTVVNPRDAFVERIRLHQLAAGTLSNVEVPLDDALHPRARLRVGTVSAIRPADKTVVLKSPDGEHHLSYDHLVYAVGSAETLTADRPPDHGVANLSSATAVRQRLDADPSARVLVVGGGPTGIETASEIAAAEPRTVVTLASDGPIASKMRPATRAGMLARLRAMGIEVLEHTHVASRGHGVVSMSGVADRTFDVIVSATSFRVPPLAKDSGLRTNDADRLLVDRTLRSLDYPSIIGAGDAVVIDAPEARHVEMGCAAAVPMGAHAADVLLALVRGREPTDFSFGYLVRCLSLGRRDGYIQPTRSDGTPLPLYLSGRPAAKVKELVCSAVIEQPVRSIDKPRLVRWRHRRSRARRA